MTNSATAISDTPDPVDANNRDVTTITPTAPAPPVPPGAPSADLVVSKRALDPALVGRRMRYAITVENRGPSAASGVTVRDVLPGQVGFVSAAATQGRCSGTSTVTCALGDLAAGARATITLTVTPRRTGAIVNSATATSPTADPNAGNNTAATSVRAGFERTRLSVRKRADRTVVTAGGVIAYRITVRNLGRATARNLRICDRLGPGLSYVTRRGSRLRNGQACWTAASLASGRSRTFRVTARTTAATSSRSVSNRVRATGANVSARTAQARVRVRPVRGPAGGVTG